ncbi:beta-1,4-galactosyltransferase galt-1-like isoform X2 [Mercenaria mercenaria]|nr:beta-1,4-galactosyltransferase galt-1-like isoform X2 [Mercenaria mercenaria]XP_053396493.1 beta-1,4-galactosyltransferase galt-1-like isoform X2 [Mercenaria mercenaria]XP_053396494.1 beta-1,4-galactosyltransferase galt-1-like isoform X2 [Mercenaria mercenaria]XP_053396495.1 beta-1,4-galactosyltransferase galt-1-like isoform X2 [Mercenaria mercenaria]
MRCRINFRFYMLLLSAVYFTMLYIFHGNLQSETQKPDRNKLSMGVEMQNAFLKIQPPIDIKRKVLASHQEFVEITASRLHVQQVFTTSGAKRNDIEVENSIISTKRTSQMIQKTSECFLPAVTPNRTFQTIEPTFYVYSAYLDRRYNDRFVRIMALLSLNKGNRQLKVSCSFRNSSGSIVETTANFYELCENHGRMYGGFILSCPIPNSDVCHVNVSLQIKPVHRNYVVPETVQVRLPVTQLGWQEFPDQTSGQHENHGQHATFDMPYNFSICVPPLFGDIDVMRFVEFLELNRILGFQHFIFYVSTIKNPDMYKILDHYKKMGIVTIIEWALPSNIRSGQIWYNGQLSAHNDCLYRAMSLTQYLAIIDLDEFIVPHNGEITLTNLIPKLFDDKVCGLSFNSAFYDKKFSKSTSTSRLLTARHTGRSAIFSKVRTKVLIKPSKIFEVGIHHISKPAAEDFKVDKVDTSVAYLHHYRDCVPNYGMKCKDFVEDNTLLNTTSQLEDNISSVLKLVFKERKKQE